MVENTGIDPVTSRSIIHGCRMNVGEPLELTDTPKLTKDQQSYYNWLSHRLKGIHDAVVLNQKDNKEQMKVAYDRRHNVSSPTFKVGDKVLLQEKLSNLIQTRF